MNSVRTTYPASGSKSLSVIPEAYEPEAEVCFQDQFHDSLRNSPTDGRHFPGAQDADLPHHVRDGLGDRVGDHAGGAGPRIRVDQKKHMETLGKDLVIVWGGRTSSQVGGWRRDARIT